MIAVRHQIFQTVLCVFYFRQKVKEEIARDRAARAEKEKEKQSATAPPQEGTQPNATAATNTTQPKKEYDTCRLQVIM